MTEVESWSCRLTKISHLTDFQAHPDGGSAGENGCGLYSNLEWHEPCSDPAVPDPSSPLDGGADDGCGDDGNWTSDGHVRQSMGVLLYAELRCKSNRVGTGRLVAPVPTLKGSGSGARIGLRGENFC